MATNISGMIAAATTASASSTRSNACQSGACAPVCRVLAIGSAFVGRVHDGAEAGGLVLAQHLGGVHPEGVLKGGGDLRGAGLVEHDVLHAGLAEDGVLPRLQRLGEIVGR